MKDEKAPSVVAQPAQKPMGEQLPSRDLHHREKTQAYKTFSSEEITWEDREEEDVDHDTSLYAKFAARNAAVDAPEDDEQK